MVFQTLEHHHPLASIFDAIYRVADFYHGFNIPQHCALEESHIEQRFAASVIQRLDDRDDFAIETNVNTQRSQYVDIAPGTHRAIEPECGTHEQTQPSERIA